MKTSRIWLTPAIASLLALGTLFGSYTMVQQTLRLSANLAPAAAAHAIDAASTSQTSSAASSISLPPGLAYIMQSGNDLVIHSSNAPSSTPPQGVIEYALQHGEDRVTWQLADGRRYALVVIRSATERGSWIAVFQPLEPYQSIIDRASILWLATSLAVIVLAGAWILLRRRVINSLRRAL